MVEWANTVFTLLCSHWRHLFIGGVVIVGVVIFLMGLFKASVANRIRNKLVRKTVLSFSSVLLVAPVTFVYMTIRSWSTDHFWMIYAANTFATIFVYWFYEGTHVRELLELIGKKTVFRFFSFLCSSKPVEESLVCAVNQTEKDVIRSYKDDDLKKL